MIAELKGQRPVVCEDTIPRLGRCSCGGLGRVLYEPAPEVACLKCEEKVILESRPFFRSPASQREHEAWRAVIAWNDLKGC
ncbi:hypothetical protein Rleg4DRAFT_7672 [Rhizobium leguminosarum bv. trifolii WSM2297]|uniref:Uncharacterized protein n=1 Tax=Rhizobium leguminosarum bv. trifolii WSM2297 TaxID=754762 RepID=J0L4W6_RHILT|nr:hypothetical protein [Rhizobium leguminosarum]EJC85339.1 hypothetical protein Rleg4DRAFT_7219 [Rhizobium leguminosarum bv. trifolii WSM2297]EJC85777.1 hypothetical protein Rleg4DRAFT_7672 [Rhizobium leguminosarum bv. trifolii WSM2297]